MVFQKYYVLYLALFFLPLELCCLFQVIGHLAVDRVVNLTKLDGPNHLLSLGLVVKSLFVMKP